MFYDLHIHTTVSDGTLSPEQAVDFAINQGLAGIAITDHDTVGGIDLARRYIELNSFSFTFIPGVELNTEKNGMEIHILGYFVDPHYSLLEEKLRNIREARLVRGQQMVDKLINMGFKITLDQVKELASGGVIGRPHIAMALKRNGYVNSITEAFDRYLGKGRPAYVPRYKFVPEEAIELIKKAGGISILAHPGLIGSLADINHIIDMGVEGIEVFYPEHDPAQTRYFLELSYSRQLLVTGGSDFHGPGNGEMKNCMGHSGINEKHMQHLMDYYKCHKQ